MISILESMFITRVADLDSNAAGDAVSTLILGVVVLGLVLVVTAISSRSSDDYYWYNSHDNNNQRFPFLYCRHASVGLSSSTIASLLFPYRALLSAYFENDTELGGTNNNEDDDGDDDDDDTSSNGSSRSSNTNNTTSTQNKKKKIKKTKNLLLTKDHIEMIVQRDWKTLQKFISYHPNLVSKLRDTKRQSILHHACLFRAPTHVIESILHCAPEVAAVQNVDGELALHWAIRLAIPNTILLLLLHAYPQSPFIPDKDNITPLSLLWDRHQSKLMQVWKREQRQQQQDQGEDESSSSYSSSTSSSSSSSSSFPSSPKEKLINSRSWNRILTMFRIAYQYKQSIAKSKSNSTHSEDGGGSGSGSGDDRYHYQRQQDATKGLKGPSNDGYGVNDEDDHHEFLPLHAAALQSCLPFSLFSFMIGVYYDQLSKRDIVWGRTPLAIAAASGPESIKAAFLSPMLMNPSTRGDGSTADGDGIDHDNTALTSATTKIQLLLRECPSVARIRDNDGRYPLHLAAMSGIHWESGVEELFNSYPQALGITDPVSGLFPFQIGASVTATQVDEVAADCGGPRHHDITTTYRLLRADPSLLSACGR